MNRIYLYLSTALCLSLSSCYDKDTSPLATPSEDEEIVLKTISMDGHPESITQAGDRYFVSVVGKELKPTEKDGDGFIVELDKNGAITSPSAFPSVSLNAPKGMALKDDVLYIADIDRIVPINIKTKKQGKVIDLSAENISFLNDLVLAQDGTLYASATDTGKIYKVNTDKGTYAPLETTIPTPGPNGLYLSPDQSTLYVVCYAADEQGKGTGKLWSIHLPDGATTEISGLVGQFDGVSLQGEDLFFTDWEKNGLPGALRSINLKSGKICELSRIPINGPADFLIEADQKTIWIPAMIDKKIIRAGIVAKPEQ